MGIKLKKIDRVPTSLKELIDVDSSTGITRCVDCISNGMILVASVSEIYKRDTFVFKHLTDIIKVGLGMQATLVNGVMTISSSLESLNLNDLLDVSITNPADDDVLTYNSILQRWENTASGWVPTSRTISINGVIQDLSANRSWTISGGSGTVTSVTGTGTVSGLTLSGTGTTSVTLTLGGILDVISALGFTPYNATNPAGYITTSALANYVTNSSLSSTLTNYVTSSTFSSTISGLSSVYQPLFVTDNGLTYAPGTLKLGGDLTQDTTISGTTTRKLYLHRFTELKLEADDSSNATSIHLYTTQMQVKTPLYSSASVGDVLTMLDPTTGEVEFQAPTGGSGGGDMNKSVYDIDNDGVVDKAETVQIVVRNSTGATLTKGQVVYLLGATGNRPNAVLSDASTEATSSKTIGLVSANIADNTDGYVTVSGSMHDLNLGTFADGDRLWLSTTPGQMVANTPPAEPAHAVFIGTVARAHPTLGRIVLAIQNGYELTELHGVQVPSPSNNDVLRYNSTSGLWEDDSIPTILGYTPANIDSPAFTGTPTAPTPASGDNDTSIATTAFVTNAVQQSLSFEGYFGAGTDGSVTINGSSGSGGTVTLANDMFYNDLTIDSGGILYLNGYRIFVNGTLNLTNAGSNAIHNNGYTGNQSISSTGGQNLGGTFGRGGFGSTVYGWFVGGSGAVSHKNRGGNGGSSGANGLSPTPLLTTEGLIGGPGGTGGKGGNSASGATGGNGATGQVTGITVTNFTTFIPQTFQPPAPNGTFFLRQRQDVASTSLTSFTATNYIYFGGGHGGGGGGPAVNGFAGSAGGGGGGTTVIYARNIVVGPSTDSSAIAANGGNGGLVGTPSVSAQCGGGGGGGGGGFVYLIAGSISGTSGIPFVSANGGTGGQGGTAVGAGNFGGQGGAGGNGGKIIVVKLSDNSVTVVDSTAVAGATAALPTGTAGTAGTVGGTCTYSS